MGGLHNGQISRTENYSISECRSRNENSIEGILVMPRTEVALTSPKPEFNLCWRNSLWRKCWESFYRKGLNIALTPETLEDLARYLEFFSHKGMLFGGQSSTLCSLCRLMQRFRARNPPLMFTVFLGEKDFWGQLRGGICCNVLSDRRPEARRRFSRAEMVTAWSVHWESIGLAAVLCKTVANCDIEVNFANDKHSSATSEYVSNLDLSAIAKSNTVGTIVQSYIHRYIYIYMQKF